MTREDCFFLGRITRTHGLKGGLKVKLDGYDPYDFIDQESVFLDIDGNLVPFFIHKYTVDKGEFIILQFDDIPTVEDAEPLIGREIFLPRTMLEELDDQEYYIEDLIGFDVIDEEHGELGKVSDVFDFGSHAVMQIMLDYKEILIPINDETMQEVDQTKKVISVRTPDGLVDMYLNE